MDIPVQILLRLINELSGPAREAADSLKGIGDEARKLADVVPGSTANITSAFSDLETGVGRVASGVGMLITKFAALEGAAILASYPFIKTGQQFEDFYTQIVGKLGPDRAKATADEMQVLGNWATKTGTTDFMKAFVEGYQRGIIFNTAQLKSMADASAASGIPIQVIAAGIGGADVGLARALKKFNIVIDEDKKTGKTTVSYKDDKGATQTMVVETADAANKIRIILTALDAKFKGTEERFKGTWSGLSDQVWDFAETFRKKVSDAGLFEFAKNKLGNFTDWLDQKAKDGSLDLWAKQVSDGLIKVLNAGAVFAETTLPVLVKGLSGLVDVLGKLPTGVLWSLAAALIALPELIAIGSGLASIATALVMITNASGGGAAAGAAGAGGAFAGMFTLAAGLTAIAAALIVLDQYKDTYRKFIEGLSGGKNLDPGKNQTITGFYGAVTGKAGAAWAEANLPGGKAYYSTMRELQGLVGREPKPGEMGPFQPDQSKTFSGRWKGMGAAALPFKPTNVPIATDAHGKVVEPNLIRPPAISATGVEGFKKLLTDTYDLWNKNWAAKKAEISSNISTTYDKLRELNSLWNQPWATKQLNINGPTPFPSGPAAPGPVKPGYAPALAPGGVPGQTSSTKNVNAPVNVTINAKGITEGDFRRYGNIVAAQVKTEQRRALYDGQVATI